jgi:hypothetical protein
MESQVARAQSRSSLVIVAIRTRPSPNSIPDNIRAALEDFGALAMDAQPLRPAGSSTTGCPRGTPA